MSNHVLPDSLLQSIRESDHDRGPAFEQVKMFQLMQSGIHGFPQKH